VPTPIPKFAGADMAETVLKPPHLAVYPITAANSAAIAVIIRIVAAGVLFGYPRRRRA
jgi:hypothetical protein